ncbi:MAG: DNA-directed RNA polymerase subunit delta [Bacilli bacterium]|nr:DNA-directed RNA polymerase subunit delta [Bacilli bacterium]
MSETSLINHALNVLNASNKPLTFKELFDRSVKEGNLQISEDALKSKISSLYTQLLSDSRFTLLDDKTWDLSSRYSYEKTHKQYDFLDEDDEEEIDAEEKELLEEELGEELSKRDEENEEVDYDKPKDEDEDF